MAELDHSSDEISDDSGGGSSQDSNEEFSEDEETLIERMFNLLGLRKLFFFIAVEFIERVFTADALSSSKWCQTHTEQCHQRSI